MTLVQVRKNACQSIQRISQATVLALLANVANNPVPNNPLNPAAAAPKPFILTTIPLDHWDIVSFNPARREVCIRLYRYENGQRTGDFKVISVTLPVVAYVPN